MTLLRYIHSLFVGIVLHLIICYVGAIKFKLNEESFFPPRSALLFAGGGPLASPFVSDGIKARPACLESLHYFKKFYSYSGHQLTKSIILDNY